MMGIPNLPRSNSIDLSSSSLKPDRLSPLRKTLSYSRSRAYGEGFQFFEETSEERAKVLKEYCNVEDKVRERESDLDDNKENTSAREK